MRIFFISLLCYYMAVASEINGAWNVNAGALNPHLYSPNQMYAQVMVYQSLVRFDDGIKPQIAQSWEISNDGKKYTFHIKPNLTFSDGAPLDAYAIEKNFNAILANKSRHTWLGITDKIKSAKALDSHTFVLMLHSPYQATLYELSLPRPYRFISPNAMINNGTKDGIKAPIGSGAWVLYESVLGVKDVFIPNKNFHGKQPNISKLTIKILPDPNARILALKSGSVDILVGVDILSREHFNHLKNDMRFTTITSKPQGTLLVVINASNDKLTRDKRLREAIISAIDRDSIWENIALRIGERASNMFNPNIPYCDVNLAPYAFNPNQSSEILKQIHWDKSNTLNLLYEANNPLQKSIAQAMQLQLAKVGISLKPIASEPIQFVQAQKNGDFDLIFNSTWGSPFDPHSFIASMKAPSHADFAAQKDLADKQKIDYLIDMILQSTDKKTTKQGYQELLTILHTSNIYIPLHYDVVLGAYNSDKIASYNIGAMESEFLFEEMEVK